MKPVYVIFWEMLPLALFLAEVKRGFPETAVNVMARLRHIEAVSGTGYLGLDDNGVTGPELAAQRIHELIDHVYSGHPIPFWLKMAEGK